ICKNNGEIYAARKRVKWPGLAAVVVSVVHGIKGTFRPLKRLDARDVGSITAFLVDRGGHDDPAPLERNAHTAFIAYGVYGPGFTFEDGNPEANALVEVQRLLVANDENRKAISLYLGGEEFTSSPTFSPQRYVINFGQRTLEQVQSKWPELLDLVRKKVK